jgi:hypothetical protein
MSPGAGDASAMRPRCGDPRAIARSIGSFRVRLHARP